MVSEGQKASFFLRKSTGSNSNKTKRANRSHIHIIWSCVLALASLSAVEANIGKHLEEK